MIQVSTQSELQAALRSQESQIEIIADFPLNSQIAISYDVTLGSPGVSAAHTLTKDATYSSYLIRINEGGTLRLQNITIDGNRDAHPYDNTDNRALIFLAGGSLYLGSNAVLQNNTSAMEGGGVYLSGSTEYSTTFIMNSNASIRNCNTTSNGGGLMIASRNAGDSVTIAESAVIESNTAANGGGIYCRSYVSDVGASLSIADSVQIINNEVTGAGGGIYFSGYRSAGSTPSALSVSETAVINANQADQGGASA